jgi:tripartite-type tricarboxylate transporter receptor subunit TctC
VLAAPTASVRTIGFSGAATQLWAAVLQGTHRPELTLVNFSAPGQVPAAAAQGEIDLSVTSILTGLTWVQQGRVQPLLTTGQRRSGRAPTVATARELGFPELEAASWYGIVVPIQTNDAVVNYWNQEIRRVLTNKSVLEEYQNLEIHIDPGTPMDFSKFMSREIQRWQQTMVQSGIKIGF